MCIGCDRGFAVVLGLVCRGVIGGCLLCCLVCG